MIAWVFAFGALVFVLRACFACCFSRRFLHLDLLGRASHAGFYINFRQLAINGHQCCVLAHAVSPQHAEHALVRKCSLMATPSKLGNGC